MPFAKKINTTAGIIGIWEICETPGELEKQFVFSQQERKEYRVFKADKRKIEYLAARLLIHHILNKKAEIRYNKAGKPFLAGDTRHISISHSKNLVVIIVSENKTGIDTELCNRNMERVAGRFLSETERNNIAGLADAQTAKVIYWGAKESIFKCTEQQGINYHRQIEIEPFAISGHGEFSGKLILQSKKIAYRLWYFSYQNNMIVFCVEEKDLK